MDWNQFWQDIVDFFTDTGNIITIVGFVAALILGIIVVKLIVRICRKLFSKGKLDKIAQNFFLAILKFVLYLILVLILLSIIGVEVSGIITALSACVLAIGLALESIITNLANGIIIVSAKLVKQGDFVEVAGVSGSVHEIHFLFTTITTVDNKRITLPNSTITASALTNYGANPTRRVDFTFSVAYESDVEEVKQIVVDVMKSNGKVLLDPAPFCRLKTLNSSSLDFFSNCWCDGSDYWDVYYYVVENVYNEFKRHNISVPFAQMEVRQRVDEVVMPVIGEGLPERVEKERPVEEKKFDLENDSLRDLVKSKKEKKNKDK